MKELAKDLVVIIRCLAGIAVMSVARKIAFAGLALSGRKQETILFYKGQEKDVAAVWNR